MNKFRQLALAAVVTTVAAAALHMTTANAVDAQITSPGPITRIRISPTLDCGADWVEDAQPLFYADSACGTFLTDGTTLWGPSATPGSEGFIGTVVPFTPLSQSVRTSGSQTTIETRVRAGNAFEITQSDTYVRTSEYIGTSMFVKNLGTNTASPILYRAFDCTLQGADNGFAVELGGGNVGCQSATGNAPGPRTLLFQAGGDNTRYLATASNSLWAAIGSKTEFTTGCTCNALIDNAAGISVRLPNLAPDATTGYGHFITMQSATWVSNTSPNFVAPTPAEGSVVNATTGALTTVHFKATDADSDPLTVTPTTPPGLGDVAFTVSSGDPLTGSLAFRAPAPGDYPITLKLQDYRFQQLRHFTIHATGKAPTSLQAHPAVVALPKKGAKTILPVTLSATLTSLGSPLAGKSISFRSPSNQELCRAVTDGDGFADCQSAAAAVQALVNFDFIAHFYGDSGYFPSSSNGDLIQLLGLPLP